MENRTNPQLILGGAPTAEGWPAPAPKTTPQAASPLRLRYPRNLWQPTRRNVFLKFPTDNAQPATAQPSNPFSDPTRPVPRRTEARHQRVHTRFKQA